LKAAEKENFSTAIVEYPQEGLENKKMAVIDARLLDFIVEFEILALHPILKVFLLAYLNF